MLSSDLIARLRSRAADPKSRTDAPDTTPETSFFGGVFKTVRVPIGDAPAPPISPPPLSPPASAEEIATAQAMLGLALPDDLKQLYTEVANGGFGPSGGLASLEEATKLYLDLIANPHGERGQKWPEHLLPINLTEPGADCYDLKSGQIVLWDEESLADGPSDRIWKRSFKQEAKSLGAWLEAWLSKPPMGEQLKQDMEDVMLEGLRSSIAYWRAKSPEERAEMGLPEEGWEEQLFGHLGIDLKDL
jgi:hypothetical protein